MQTDYTHNTLAQALTQTLKPRAFEQHTLNFRQALSAETFTPSFPSHSARSGRPRVLIGTSSQPLPELLSHDSAQSTLFLSRTPNEKSLTWLVVQNR